MEGWCGEWEEKKGEGKNILEKVRGSKVRQILEAEDVAAGLEGRHILRAGREVAPALVSSFKGSRLKISSWARAGTAVDPRSRRLLGDTRTFLLFQRAGGMCFPPPVLDAFANCWRYCRLSSLGAPELEQMAPPPAVQQVADGPDRTQQDDHCLTDATPRSTRNGHMQPKWPQRGKARLYSEAAQTKPTLGRERRELSDSNWLSRKRWCNQTPNYVP